MNVTELIGFFLAFVVMVIGLIGTFVPGIPGAPLIFIAAVGHKLYFGEQSVSYLALGLMVFFMLLSLVLDLLASVLGAKKLGATWRGMLGAVIGAMVGVFFNLPGLILGPLLGAFLFEWAAGREWRESAKAGGGALLGLVFGAIGRIGCCVVMIAIFVFSAGLTIWSPSPADTTTVALRCQN
jgi:uncharacterized protein YqgC (DUF456 family)